MLQDQIEQVSAVQLRSSNHDANTPGHYARSSFTAGLLNQLRLGDEHGRCSTRNGTQLISLSGLLSKFHFDFTNKKK